MQALATIHNDNRRSDTTSPLMPSFVEGIDLAQDLNQKAGALDRNPSLSSRKMTAQQVPYISRQASLTVDFIIIGGGLSGLACALALRRVGHRVLVLEKDPRIQNAGLHGGGCRMPPNVWKILCRWGLGEKLAQVASVPKTMHLYKYETGEFLGVHVWSDEALREAEGEYSLVRHSDLWQLLYDGAIAAGARIRSDADVISVDPDQRTVTLRDGEVLTADIIIGADGPQGLTRKLLCDEPTVDLPKSFMIYEATIPADKLNGREEFGPILSEKGRTNLICYFGDGICAYLFPIDGATTYGFHLLTPDDGSEGLWGDTPSMKLEQVIRNAEPRIRTIAQLARSAVRISGSDMNKLENWVHDSQRLVVIGEAAHPFPPGALQGSAMAIEDAAVLGKLFSWLSTEDQIGNFLWAFEDLRQGRCSVTLEDELNLFKFLTMRPGPQQEARDVAIRERHAAGKTDFGDGEDVAAQEWESQKRVYGYDCEDEADGWWVQWGLLRQRAKERSSIHGLDAIMESSILPQQEVNGIHIEMKGILVDSQ